MASLPKEKSKELFFSELYSLDDLAHDSDSEFPQLKSRQPTILNTNIKKQLPPRPSDHLKPPHRPRSNPSLPTSVILPVKAPATSEQPERPKKIRRTQSDKKASRGKNELKLVPEKEQIFKGLVFYFIPNNDVAGPRNARIRKALEHGCIWSKTGIDEVTHVIVDSSLNDDDLIRELQHHNLPDDVPVVNDRFLTDSVGHKTLRGVTASRYQVSKHVFFSSGRRDQHFLESVELGEARIKTKTPSPIITYCRSAANDNTVFSLESNGALKSSNKSSTSGQQPDSNQLRTDRSRDALDEMVEEVVKPRGLPLDLEEDQGAELFHSADGNFETDGKVLTSAWENTGFQCMHKNHGEPNGANPNSRTIEVLQQMASHYDRVGDNWRTLGYRKAITALRKYPAQVTTRKEATAIPGIGKRLAAKIEEIVVTNRLQRLESMTNDSNDSLLRLFMGVYQVGYSSAQRWIAQGYRTLEELKAHPDLTPNQKTGIDHYHDFLQRIPRAEVTEHASIVRRALHLTDPMLQAIVGGSYRRGNVDSGDIDILITKKDASLEHVRMLLMDSAIPHLFQTGFLKVKLAAGTSRNECSKWHGACSLPGSDVWRRIDLLFVPWNELGAALIYFTGNDIFNRSIRLLASRKGMRLNQHGLFKDVMRRDKRQKMTDGTLVEGATEERIFEILRLRYRPPEHRKC